MQVRFALTKSAILLLGLSWAHVSYANELKPNTVVAFNFYVSAAEARMDSELLPRVPFLWVDTLGGSHRQRMYTDLQNGQIEVRQQRPEPGQSTSAGDGLIHDWIGIAFIPGVHLQQVLAVLQDYDRHADIFKPSVRRSKLLEHEDQHFKIYLQLCKDSPARVAFNTEFDVSYIDVDSSRVASRAISTRIAELKNPGDPDSPEYPVGTGRGYLWRMNNYWRLEEKDGGVYVQIESIALSRSVPTLLTWFVNPLIRRAARETLMDSLGATRRAVTNSSADAHRPAAP